MAAAKHKGLHARPAEHAPRHARPMLRVSLRNIAAHKLRLLLSVLAVVLGTAFVTGSLVFTSTLKSTFDGLLDQGTADLAVMIEPEDPRGAGVPFEVADRILDVPGVAAATPGVSGTVVLFNADGTPYQSGGAPSEGTCDARTPGIRPPRPAGRPASPRDRRRMPGRRRRKAR